jgi:hypothetical protein
MALMKIWSGSRFRTRDPRRDRATDVERLQRVRSALLAALEEARRERDGLQQRVALDYGRAASLLDETEAYEARSSAEEAEISEAERHAGAALARVQGLGGQIALLERLLAELDEAVAWRGEAASA